MGMGTIMMMTMTTMMTRTRLMIYFSLPYPCREYESQIIEGAQPAAAARGLFQ
jgi:hypothetical protein